MNQNWPLLAVLSFVGGLLVASRVASWVFLVAAFVKQPRATHRMLSAPSLFLHSGPWVLAIGVAAVRYVSASQPSYLWSVVGGLCAAAAAVLCTFLFASWRRRYTKLGPQPLTPERLLAIRRRFFWINSLGFAVFLPLGLMYMSPELSRSDGQLLGLFVGVVAFCTGWFFSWFMWQWYGEQLKVNEQARLKREQANVV